MHCEETETGGKIFKKGDGWSLNLYIVLLIEMDARGLNRSRQF